MTNKESRERGDTLLRRLHPLVKLTVLASTMLLVLASPGNADGVPVLAIWLGILFALWAVARVRIRRARRAMVLGLTVSLFMVITQGFLYRSSEGYTPLFTVYDLNLAGRQITTFTLEGLLAGVSGSMKILSVLTSSLLLVETTDLDELSYALLKLRLPYSFTFILLSGMRFMPHVQDTWSDLMDAHKLKGYDIERVSLMQRARNLYPRAVGSLLLVLFRQGLHLEISIRTRGFGVEERRTPYFTREMYATDYASFVLILVILVILLWVLR